MARRRRSTRLSEWLSVLWLTPAMDRLFAGCAGDRRRFLDRLVLALEPGHAHHAARYEAAMRARNKLLAEPDGADAVLADRARGRMAEHGAALSAARDAHCRRACRTAGRARRKTSSPRAAIALDGWAAPTSPQSFASTAAATPPPAAPPPARTGRTSLVTHAAKHMPAARCSTGEQKALLLGLVLAHAELVADRRGAPPILLLDEVAAHLDPSRRAALFARLEGRGQVWMTATEAALFDGIGEACRLHVDSGPMQPDLTEAGLFPLSLYIALQHEALFQAA